MLRNYFRYTSFDVQSSAEIRRTNFSIEIHCFSQMIHQIRQNRIPCSNVVRLQKFSVKFFGLWIIVKSERNLVKINAESSLIHPVLYNSITREAYLVNISKRVVAIISSAYVSGYEL